MKKLSETDLQSIQFAVVQIEDLLMQSEKLRKEKSRSMTYYEVPANERRAFVAGVEAVEDLLSAQSNVLGMELAKGRLGTSRDPGFVVYEARKARRAIGGKTKP